MKELDCRGMACPQPVLTAKDALDDMESGQVTVMVDNTAARDNVTRFAQSQGCLVDTAADGDNFILTLTKSDLAGEAPSETTCSIPGLTGPPRVVVKVPNRFMGGGSEDLGRVLMKAFIKALAEATLKPEAIVFYNAGVYLTCAGSEHLDAIRTLEDSGVKVLSCGTCLDFYNLKEKLEVGAVTNMFEIIEILSGADRVVAP